LEREFNFLNQLERRVRNLCTERSKKIQKQPVEFLISGPGSRLLQAILAGKTLSTPPAIQSLLLDRVLFETDHKKRSAAVLRFTGLAD